MSMTFENTPTKSVDVNGTNFVFREIGRKGGVPVVFLHHLTAVLDDWDPRVVDGLAAKHHVIVFDNRGVGGSGGSTPKTVEEMARDTVAFRASLAAVGAWQHAADLVHESLGKKPTAPSDEGFCSCVPKGVVRTILVRPTNRSRLAAQCDIFGSAIEKGDGIRGSAQADEPAQFKFRAGNHVHQRVGRPDPAQAGTTLLLTLRGHGKSMSASALVFGHRPLQ
jgi:hypothetical protein